MDQFEILVTVQDDPNPRKVEFSDLFPLRESLQSVMFLFNTNSYYVDALSKTFIINGGRRICFKELGECEILYRKRNRAEVSLTGDQKGSPMTFYLIGLREKETGRVVFTMVTEDGASWEWGNTL